MRHAKRNAISAETQVLMAFNRNSDDTLRISFHLLPLFAKSQITPPPMFEGVEDSDTFFDGFPEPKLSRGTKLLYFRWRSNSLIVSELFCWSLQLTIAKHGGVLLFAHLVT